MDTPTTKFFARGVCCNRAMIASTPSFLKPLFTSMLFVFGRRVSVGVGLPAHGRAVTDPTYTPPKPRLGKICTR
jgi:hypothetical protein